MPISIPGIAQRFEFEMSLDVIQNNRDVYTLMDMLGDIGGLLDITLIFVKVAWTIVFTISGGELTRHLANNLFYIDERDKSQRERNNIVSKMASNTLKAQQRANFGRCISLKSLIGNKNKDADYLKRAKQKMSKELDIV